MINLSTLQGYLGDEGLTANYFDTDGFAKTGDVGYYDRFTWKNLPRGKDEWYDQVGVEKMRSRIDGLT